MRGEFVIPELPEVETVRRELQGWLTGRRILSASLVDALPGPKYAGIERAAGQRIVAVSRRGKFLLLPLSEGDELIIHLGMTGVISAVRPEKHLRVMVELNGADRPTLYFRDARRFGRFLVVAAGNYELLPTLRAMGPEPLSEALTAAAFHCALQRSTVAIKTYLLSQRPVSGVGNIYADEALWKSRIHPLTPANLISTRKAGKLLSAIREVMTESILAQGTTLNDYRTVNGEVGGYLDQLKVYGHEEEPCPRCAGPIMKIVLAGRSSYYCPRCQRRRA